VGTVVLLPCTLQSLVEVVDATKLAPVVGLVQASDVVAQRVNVALPRCDGQREARCPRREVPSRHRSEFRAQPVLAMRNLR
jgi:hypothetical protein